MAEGYFESGAKETIESRELETSESLLDGNLGGTSSDSWSPPACRSRSSARRYRIIDPRLGRSSNMASLEPGFRGDEMNEAEEIDRIAARD